MAVAWTIQGESGKDWDETIETFSDRKIEDATFEFRHLDSDVFQFQISSSDITTETLPEIEQKIVVYRDGVRYFTGNVTNRVVRINSGSQVCIIQVSGPWWWMDKIQFTSSQTIGTSSTSQDRLSILLGPATGQSLKTSIETVINRCVDLGVPIAKTTATQPSTVATMGNFSQITLNQSNCASTFSETIRNCPDAMTYFDYSLEVPALRVVRRRSGLTSGSAPVLTLNAQSDPITSLDINPILGLEVEQVDIRWLTRQTDGATIYGTPQKFPASGTFSPQKIQTFCTSGEELDTFLPNNLYDTVAFTTTTSIPTAIIKTSTAGQQYQKSFPTRNPITTAGFQTTIKTNTATGFTLTYINVPPATINKSGTIYLFGDNQNETPPDWAIKQMGLTEASITGAIVGYEYYPITQSEFDAFVALFSSTDILYGSSNAVSWRTITEPIKVYVKTGTVLSSPVYRDPDYVYVAPPSGMAQFLKEAQDYVPYEGSIEIIEQDAGGIDYRGKRVNISNSMPEYSSMGALVSAVSIDVKSGLTNISFGQPPRHDFRNIMDRIRKTSQDNIIILQS